MSTARRRAGEEQSRALGQKFGDDRATAVHAWTGLEELQKGAACVAERLQRRRVASRGRNWSLHLRGPLRRVRLSNQAETDLSDALE